MLYEIMKHVRNFFPCGRALEGSFQIENGTMSLLSIQNGSYFVIEGSRFNDGVYIYPPYNLTDEAFNGAITPIAPPQSFLDLVSEIEAWQQEHAKPSEFQSESFGGYSYSKATGHNGAAYAWTDAFRNRLNAWRKL